MNLPFVLLSALAANFVIRRLLVRYPPDEEWLTTVLIMFLASFLFAAVGVMLGQQWSGLAEVLRIGNGHLSNRALRLPMNRYQGARRSLSESLYF